MSIRHNQTNTKFKRWVCVPVNLCVFDQIASIEFRFTDFHTHVHAATRCKMFNEALTHTQYRSSSQRKQFTNEVHLHDKAMQRCSVEHLTISLYREEQQYYYIKLFPSLKLIWWNCLCLTSEWYWPLAVHLHTIDFRLNCKYLLHSTQI